MHATKPARVASYRERAREEHTPTRCGSSKRKQPKGRKTGHRWTTCRRHGAVKIVRPSAPLSPCDDSPNDSRFFTKIVHSSWESLFSVFDRPICYLRLPPKPFPEAQPALQRPDSSLNLESPPGSADRVLPLLPLSEPATGTTTGAAATTHGTTAGRSASASAAQALGRGPLAHLRANAAAALAGLARRVSKSTVRSRSTPYPGVCVPSGPCPRRPCRRCTAASGR